MCIKELFVALQYFNWFFCFFFATADLIYVYSLYVSVHKAVND